jgi:hypothetical protein
MRANRIVYAHGSPPAKLRMKIAELPEKPFWLRISRQLVSS